ncbi:hypothetical protein EJ06DRAFT_506399 [Trichodelitschia bisporula]|uniref:Regulator of volume decrease after cellular swelling-domain-containing protein n=1 Tax=Trichodelitschia bisporula TaxID=703511 RepID=A0A6G1I4E2_9PEZI|nr:hypothetical protein EJ06DRAFT_506399 [Trichodelitschia bisporula]
MSLEPLTSAPTASQFTPLSEHQSHTPTTFFGGPAVLHYHSPASSLIISKADYDRYALVRNLCATPPAEDAADVQITGVDVWITSANVLLFSPTASTGLSISYPIIALHALGTYPPTSAPMVYLQLDLYDVEQSNSDDDIETLHLNIIPASAGEGAAADTATPPAKQLFEALCACADLNPDTEEDGETPDETAPGATGWITSENMADFMDADGNFIGATELGPGAGTVRGREDDEVEDNDGTNGEDSKWQRTE